MCAEYIESCLKGKPLDFAEIKTHLINHPCSSRFLNDAAKAFRKRDFDLCLTLDKFSFVLKAEKQENNLIYLRKINFHC